MDEDFLYGLIKFKPSKIKHIYQKLTYDEKVILVSRYPHMIEKFCITDTKIIIDAIKNNDSVLSYAIDLIPYDELKKLMIENPARIKFFTYQVNTLLNMLDDIELLASIDDMITRKAVPYNLYILGDIINKLTKTSQYDLILSNPSYLNKFDMNNLTIDLQILYLKKRNQLRYIYNYLDYNNDQVVLNLISNYNDYSDMNLYIKKLNSRGMNDLVQRDPHNYCFCDDVDVLNKKSILRIAKSVYAHTFFLKHPNKIKELTFDEIFDVLCKNYNASIILNYDIKLSSEQKIAIVRSNPKFLKYFVNELPEREICNALSIDGELIKHIKNPSDAFKKIAIMQNVNNINYISNISEKVLLELVDVHPTLALFIKSKRNSKKLFEKAKHNELVASIYYRLDHITDEEKCYLVMLYPKLLEIDIDNI